MWALEHILFAIKFVLMSIIPDVPRNIRIFQAKQAIAIHDRNLQNKMKISSSLSSSSSAQGIHSFIVLVPIFICFIRQQRK